MKQKTLAKNVTLKGVGLHTGVKVQATFKPAETGSGIRFIRTDLNPRVEIKAAADCVKDGTAVSRCTSVASQEITIHTVEHAMSALAGLGISNAIIEINANELPGLDGSSLDYVKAFRKAGIVEQNQSVKAFAVREPLGVERNGASIYIVPSHELKIFYTLDYDHPRLRSQFVSLAFNEAAYEKDIAPCRTFCLQSEIAQIRDLGLGKGADSQNTLVIGEGGAVKNKFRFPDECARHKILDFIGDLYLLGVPILGHVYAVKSGHSLNIELLKKIRRQKDMYVPSLSPHLDGRGYKIYDIQDIMKILPHRYPFLLLDRFYEVKCGQKGIGVKNVTANDEFFQGHFPTRPVMPGVMMIEAMAQAGGMAVLTHERHRGKLAFFMAVDKVKFRRVVSPGDQLIMDVDVIRDRARTVQVNGVARVGGEIAAEAEMMFSFTDLSYLFG